MQARKLLAVLGTKDQEKRQPFRPAMNLGGTHDGKAGDIRYASASGHLARQFPTSTPARISPTRPRPRFRPPGQACEMHMANNPRTKQQLGVKQARLTMNDPHTSSLSLEAMTPNPGKTPSATMALCMYVSPHDASAGWEKVECLMMLWTGAISCNRGRTTVYKGTYVNMRESPYAQDRVRSVIRATQVALQ